MKNRLFGIFRRARSVCAPKNAGKRIFAAFLSVCVAVSAFVVPVHAIPAVIPFLGELFLDFIVGYAAGTSAHAILNSNSDLNDLERQQILSSVSEASASGLVEFVANDDQKTIYVQPVSGLSGEQLEMAQLISESIQSDLNKSAGAGMSWSKHIYSSITNNTTLPDSPSDNALEAAAYSFLKTSAYNAMNAYVASKAYDDLLDSNNSTASAIEAALGESFPRYYFDITNPSKSSHINFKSPEKGNISSLTLNGFTFTPMISYTIGHYFTESEAKLLASYSPSYLKANYLQRSDYWVPQLNSSSPIYAYTYYYLTDDGQIYFGSGDYIANGFTHESRTLDNSPLLKDATGRTIKGGSAEAREIYSHITSIGVCMNTGNVLQSAIPVDVGTLTDDDFYTTSGGESISEEIPNTDTENIIGGAIGMGLIGADAPLTIGADGTITAADGIPIDKLGEILEAIQSGSINLDSIEDYLSLISTLVGAGNLTATEQKKILENIGAYMGAFAGDISAIKDILKEWAKAAEAEAAAENLDFDLPDVTIIDKFPFSLPFDVYYVLDLLCTDPKKPIFTIPIKTTLKAGEFSYTVDKTITLDLTTFKIGNVDMVQAVINTGVTIAFVFALIAGTRKFIWK